MIMSVALLIARWAVAVIGAIITVLALVMGTLAPTTDVTLSWAVVECVGVAVLIPGLHILIEWDGR